MTAPSRAASAPSAAVRRKLPAALASTLVVETMAGSAELLRARDGDTFGVRREVTSPGGTTAAALTVFEERRLPEALKAGVLRAQERSIELAEGK